MVVLETLLLISLQNIELSMFTSHSFYQHFEGGKYIKSVQIEVKLRV